MPAPGQGAIAITARAGDAVGAGGAAADSRCGDRMALAAERALLHVLDGSCRTPIGAFARLDGASLLLHAIVLKPDGSQSFDARISGPATEAASLGAAAGRDLLGRIPADLFEG